MKLEENRQNLVTTYVSDTSNWEEWKKEYQYGALYIFPPTELRETVNLLRAELDPKSQSYCDAHISLTVPFPRPLTVAGLQEIEQAAQLIMPLEITYGPVTSYPGHPGVVLKIEPQEQLSKLVSMLEALPVFEGANPRRYPFSAHLTIAEFITMERTAELVRELATAKLEGKFQSPLISYAVPTQDFHFEERKFIKLKP